MAMLMQSPHDAAPQQSAAKVKACMLIRSHLIAITIARCSVIHAQSAPARRIRRRASDAEIKLGNNVP